MKKLFKKFSQDFLNLLKELNIYVLESKTDISSENDKSLSNFTKNELNLVTEIVDHVPTQNSWNVNQMYEKEKDYLTFFKGIELGFLLILLSLFFKLALAPFYLWAPDIYEGAPSSTTFFFWFFQRLVYLSF